MKQIFSIILVFQLLVGLLPSALAAPTAAGQEVTILFTHDLHSHLLPANDEEGNSYGGYARLKTVIDQQKLLHPDAVLVDGGDFSMGSLFQTVYATQAAELRSMGALGYDVTTFGNHEYDYRASGLADMLNAALDSGEPVPSIVQVNYMPPRQGDPDYDQTDAMVWEAFDKYGVQDYTVIQRGGINYAVFGIMGFDADECAPMSGMTLEDPVTAAQDTVDWITQHVPEPRVVVCLSHSGTHEDPEKSEDEQLAANVDGIDVIISGHTHSTLEEPLVVGDTYIVSCGEYSKNLGVLTMTLTGEKLSFRDYKLIPIDSTVAEAEAMTVQVEEYKRLVEEDYLTRFGGLTYDQVLATNPYVFDSQSDLSAYHRESSLGNLIADSYRWAVKEAEGDAYIPVDFALTANGVIRESFATGDITVSDVFNVSSLGVGADGVPGYPLVSVWLTGKDLKNAFEVDASVTALMSAAQLHFTGMTFTFNPNRMLFDKVTECAQVLEDGTTLPIEDDKLYRVVTSLYCGQMLEAVNDKSFGILSITPRDAQGNAITDLEAFILHDENGNEIKEWYALASYLESMGTVSEEYSGSQGRKIVDDNWNPIDLIKNPGPPTLIVLGVLLVMILLVLLIVRVIRRKKNHKRK
ncbi:MAG: bifunctional metallophosphatase/5'-nucleotidase [Ruminiclostridium sp.]|nr:bifunctional metallophosphatase/5'-nucleotidase [Ruminiclostridium sp.]